jgi:hypothetical protein
MAKHLGIGIPSLAGLTTGTTVYRLRGITTVIIMIATTGTKGYRRPESSLTTLVLPPWTWPNDLHPTPSDHLLPV